MKYIQTNQAPTPGGHYSQAIVHGDTVYVSGLLPVKVGEKPDSTIYFEEQVKLVFAHMKEILEEAGSGMDRVLKVSIFLSDIENWPAVNELYSRFFGDHKPARIVVPVKDLHFGYKIEVDAIAAVKK